MFTIRLASPQDTDMVLDLVREFYAEDGYPFHPRAAAAAIRDLRVLHLEVEGDNPQAEALYRRRGFEGNARHLLTKRLKPEL